MKRKFELNRKEKVPHTTRNTAKMTYKRKSHNTIAWSPMIYYVSSQIEITFVRQEYRRLLCRHREITNWKWRLGTICSDKKIMDTDSYRILFVFRQSVPIYFKQKSSDNSLEGMKLSGSGRLKNLLLIKTVLSIMARWDPCVGDGISKHRTHKSSAYKAHTVFTKRQMLYLENLH